MLNPDELELEDDQDPKWARWSWETSNLINRNTSINYVRLRWLDLYDGVRLLLRDGRQRSSLSLEAHTAIEMRAARIARAAVVRVISHRFAMNLAPTVTALLNGDDSSIDHLLDTGRLDLDNAARRGVETEWHRPMEGDDARLCITLKELVEGPVERTLADLPAGLSSASVRCGDLLELTTREYLDARGVDWRNQKPSSPRDYSAFFTASTESRRDWNIQFHIKRAWNNQGDPGTFLVHNVAAGGHHLSAYVGDGTRDLNRMNVSPDERLRASVACLPYAARLSWMPNTPMAEAEFDGRYVWKSPFGPGRYLARHPSLLVAKKEEGQWVLVPNPASAAFYRQTRRIRNLCPGGDAVDPIGAGVETSAKLREVLRRVSAPLTTREQAMTANFLGPFSTPDVVGALGAGVCNALIGRGLMRYDRAELASLLGPERGSMGPWIGPGSNSLSGLAPIIND